MLNIFPRGVRVLHLPKGVNVVGGRVFMCLWLTSEVYTANYSNDIRPLWKCLRNSLTCLQKHKTEWGGESITHFECHNLLVSSLCQLGSNIVPHNINKDTVYIHHQLNYFFRKKEGKKSCALVREWNYRAENYVEKGIFPAYVEVG